jgi:pimeloyl-ACP methyl ester carboxylesterase
VTPPRNRDRNAGDLRRMAAHAALVCLVAVIFGAGSTAGVSQSSASPIDLPPPGRLVDVGGYRLHLFCTGTASADRPTIVLSSGGGDYAVDWGLVQPAIAGSMRVCSYDRAGTGWSDPGPEPRTLRQEAGELHLLLVAAGERPPYVMVGHSLGGLVVRLYQLQNPNEVVGMVLVEALHEDARLGYRGQLVRVRTLATGRRIPPLQTLDASPPVLLRGDELLRCQASARTGQIYGPFVKLPPKDRQLRLWAQRNPKCVAPGEDYLADELAAVHADRQQNPLPLGSMPLVVILEGQTSAPPGERPDEWRSEKAARAADLSHLSSQGRLVTAGRSGHHVHLDEPSTVIAAIRDVVQKLPGTRSAR